MTETQDHPYRDIRRGVARETIERLLTVTQSIPAADFSHDLLDYFDAGGDHGQSDRRGSLDDQFAAAGRTQQGSGTDPQPDQRCLFHRR